MMTNRMEQKRKREKNAHREKIIHLELYEAIRTHTHIEREQERAHSKMDFYYMELTKTVIV